MLDYNQIMAKKYVTVEEAALILDISTEQVQRYCAEPNPSLRTRHIGGQVMIRSKDIEHLMSGARRKRTATPPREPEIPPITSITPPRELEIPPNTSIAEVMEHIVLGEVVPPPSGTFTPELLAHIRLLEDKLVAAYHEAGRLQAQLDAQRDGQRRLTDDAASAHRQVASLEDERATLHKELERLRRVPWWVRIFWR